MVVIFKQSYMRLNKCYYTICYQLNMQVIRRTMHCLYSQHAFCRRRTMLVSIKYINVKRNKSDIKSSHIVLQFPMNWSVGLFIAKIHGIH